MILWLPVGMGIGIAFYFELVEEPSLICAISPLPWLIVLISGHAGRAGLPALIAIWAGFATSLGFSAALIQTAVNGVQMLDYRMSETVEGRVVEVSRSASGAPRILLRDVTIYGLPREKTPRAVRVSLKPGDTVPAPGDRIRIYASLSPPGGPVEPGAYDFRRHAYFAGLGAVGFAHGVVVPVPEQEALTATEIIGTWVARTRHDLSAAIRQHLPGPAGGFAAAIIVGDRAYIEEADAEALRTANLAHLLAISGLHMGILTGLVFGGVRLLLAMSGAFAMRFSAKKLAAMAALLVAAGYLVMSGSTVATQRAFIMVGVALLAVLFDRPAITLRALAIAAVVVLLIRPISLVEPGFQMSFAATCALVTGFEAIGDYLRRDRAEQAPERRGFGRRIARRVGLYVGGLVLTTILAGLATAPFAAYHFNRTAPYGLIANLAAVPVMGLVVAPSALAAGLFAPFGLEGPALKVMGEGILAILSVSRWVAGFPGAVGFVAAFPASVIAAIALSGLWLCLWRSRWRLLGLAGFAVAAVLMVRSDPRPDVLVAPDGRLTGILGPEGRVIDHPRRRSFIASNWLRRDGDPAEQSDAAARPGVERDGKAVLAHLSNGSRLVVLRKAEEADRFCTERTLVLVFQGKAPRGDCKALGALELSRMGGLAVSSDGDEVSITPARPAARRPWSVRD
ncbi:MAG: ComEC/Rec2 family competence protein [Pseudomonadota bacterium]